MSRMAELYNDLETEVERLSSTSMIWDEDTWLEQVSEGRFEGKINFKHELIFWFENYVSAYIAKAILTEMGEDFELLLDDATGEWAITTSLLTMTWRAR
jgi:hypothetical protein